MISSVNNTFSSAQTTSIRQKSIAFPKQEESKPAPLSRYKFSLITALSAAWNYLVALFIKCLSLFKTTVNPDPVKKIESSVEPAEETKDPARYVNDDKTQSQPQNPTWIAQPQPQNMARPEQQNPAVTAEKRKAPDGDNPNQGVQVDRSNRRNLAPSQSPDKPKSIMKPVNSSQMKAAEKPRDLKFNPNQMAAGYKRSEAPKEVANAEKTYSPMKSRVEGKKRMTKMNQTPEETPKERVKAEIDPFFHGGEYDEQSASMIYEPVDTGTQAGKILSGFPEGAFLVRMTQNEKWSDQGGVVLSIVKMNDNGKRVIESISFKVQEDGSIYAIKRDGIHEIHANFDEFLASQNTSKSYGVRQGQTAANVKTQEKKQVQERKYPPRGGMDSVRGKDHKDSHFTIFKDTEIYKKEYIVRNQKLESTEVNYTSNGKAIIQQPNLRGAHTAVAAMMLLDNGKKPDMVNLDALHGSGEIDDIYFEEAGLTPLKNNAEDLSQLNSLITKNGSAIVHTNNGPMIVDNISRDLKAVTLRDPYHGWEITVKSDAFIQVWKNKEVVTQVLNVAPKPKPKPASFSPQVPVSAPNVETDSNIEPQVGQLYTANPRKVKTANDLMAPFYHNGMGGNKIANKAEAGVFLKDKPIGSFVIRPAETQGKYYLSVKQELGGKDVIVDAKFLIGMDGSVGALMGGEPIRHENFADFLRENGTDVSKGIRK